MKKRLYSRRQFEALLGSSAAAMARDRKLRALARRLLVSADRHRWIHQTRWLGEPVLQLPQDMFAVQHAIYAARPELIIELGVAWGGSLLFYATLFEALGRGRVIGVDTYLPPAVRRRLGRFKKISKRISLIKGASTDARTLERVRAAAAGCRRTMVVLDSFHTHEHVLEELRLYSPLVGPGQYLICCDTHVEEIPEIVGNRPRPWGKGNNPKTAVAEFLKENPRFEADRSLEARLLLTLHPGGYLRRRPAA